MWAFAVVGVTMTPPSGLFISEAKLAAVTVTECVCGACGSAVPSTAVPRHCLRVVFMAGT
jgi:hypothetical protein